MSWWEGLKAALRALAGLPRRVHPPDPDALASAMDPSRAASLDEPGPVSRLAFAPDGSALALGLGAGAVRILPLAPGITPRRFAGLSGGVAGLAFVPRDPTLLLAASAAGELRLFTTELQTMLWSTPAPAALDLACAPGGRRLATAGSDGRLRMYSVASGREEALAAVSDRPLAALAFDPAGPGLAMLDRSGRVWLGGPPGETDLDPVPVHQGEGLALVPSEDGTLVYTLGGDRVLAVTQVAGRRCLARFPLGPAGAAAMALVPGGELMLLGGADGGLELREVVQGRLLARVDAGLGPVAAVAVSPDGSRLACGGARGAWLGSLAPAR